MQLYRLIYASRDRQPLCIADLRSALESADERDGLCQITGVLCIGQQRFIQVLEGDRTDIEQLYSRIVRDTARPQIKLLQFEPISERAFAGPGIRMLNLEAMNSELWSKIFTGGVFRPDQLKPEQAIAQLQELSRATTVIAPVAYQRISEALVAF